MICHLGQMAACWLLMAEVASSNRTVEVQFATSFLKDTENRGGNQKKKSKVSAGFHSRHFYSATIAVTAFSALGVYPGKIATPRIRTRVGGS